MLPQKVSNDIAKTMRKVEVGSNRTKFSWCVVSDESDARWGLNRSMNASNVLQLPKLFLRTYEHMKTIGGSGVQVVYNAGINIIRGEQKK